MVIRREQYIGCYVGDPGYFIMDRHTVEYEALVRHGFVLFREYVNSGASRRVLCVLEPPAKSCVWKSPAKSCVAKSPAKAQRARRGIFLREGF